jgi:putative endonuclease
MFNKRNGTLYIGVTNNLIKRVYEHKTKFNPDSFTSKYNINKLGYYEVFDDINYAIEREKKLKGSNRKKKLELIESINPNWEDLYEGFI